MQRTYGPNIFSHDIAPLDKGHIKTNYPWVSSFPDYHNSVIRRAAVLSHKTWKWNHFSCIRSVAAKHRITD